MGDLLLAMHKPFPALTDLTLQTEDDTVTLLIDPDATERAVNEV